MLEGFIDELSKELRRGEVAKWCIVNGLNSDATRYVLSQLETIMALEAERDQATARSNSARRISIQLSFLLYERTQALQLCQQVVRPIKGDELEKRFLTGEEKTPY